jgi:hypothetical protein
MNEIGGGTPPAPGGAAMHRWASDVQRPGGADVLPNGGPDGTVRHPFTQVQRAEYLALVKEHGSIAKRTHDAPIALVNLHDLHAIQDSVNRERLSQHMSDPKMVPEGSRAAGHGGLVDRPVVVRKGGKMFIHDGHHRLTAALLRGQSTAKVRFVDLDSEQSTP